MIHRNITKYIKQYSQQSGVCVSIKNKIKWVVFLHMRSTCHCKTLKLLLLFKLALKKFFRGQCEIVLIVHVYSGREYCWSFSTNITQNYHNQSFGFYGTNFTTLVTAVVKTFSRERSSCSPLMKHFSKNGWDICTSSPCQWHLVSQETYPLYIPYV